MSGEQDGRDAALYQKSPSVVSETLAGELVLLCLESGVYYGLDRVGTLIWSSLIQGNTLPQTVTQLAHRYPGTAHEQLKQDVGRLVKELSDAKLLLPTPGAHAASGEKTRDDTTGNRTHAEGTSSDGEAYTRPSLGEPRARR